MRSESTWVAAAILLAMSCALVACTDGTTPDCSLPDAGCSPVTSTASGDGATPSDAANDGANDSGLPLDASGDGDMDAGDASG